MPEAIEEVLRQTAFRRGTLSVLTSNFPFVPKLGSRRPGPAFVEPLPRRVQKEQ